MNDVEVFLFLFLFLWNWHFGAGDSGHAIWPSGMGHGISFDWHTTSSCRVPKPEEDARSRDETAASLVFGGSLFNLSLITVNQILVP